MQDPMRWGVRASPGSPCERSAIEDREIPITEIPGLMGNNSHRGMEARNPLDRCNNASSLAGSGM